MNTQSDTEGTVRKIEAAIDQWVLELPILKNPTSSCMWHLLVAHEVSLRALVMHAPPRPASSFGQSEHAKYALKYTFDWALKLFRGGAFSIPYTLNQKRLRQTEEAFFHASNYQYIIAAFTSYSRKLATAEIINSKTVRFHRDPEALKHDALGIILAQTRGKPPSEDRVTPRFEEIHRVLRAPLENIDLLGHRGVHYQVPPEVLLTVADLLRPAAQNTQFLPPDWAIRGIPIRSFREVWLWLNALCTVHSVIHDRAAIRANTSTSLTSVILTQRSSLVEEISKATSNLGREEIGTIVDLLTYDRGFPDGKRDPALQPLIPLDTQSGTSLAIAPRLIISSNGERNLISMLARHYKSEYDDTTGGFEREQVSQIKKLLQGSRYLVATQKKVPGRRDLPDIDVAIADLRPGCLLLVETKWTIEPSETWEMIERTEAQRKGVSQAQKLADYSRQHPQSIWDVCFPGSEMPGRLRIEACVAIRGFAGAVPTSQTEPVVVPEQLLVAQLKKNAPLDEIASWLMTRKFLPIEGVHFKAGELLLQFGEYKVYWPGFAILRQEMP